MRGTSAIHWEFWYGVPEYVVTPLGGPLDREKGISGTFYNRIDWGPTRLAHSPFESAAELIYHERGTRAGG